MSKNEDSKDIRLFPENAALSPFFVEKYGDGELFDGKSGLD